MFSAEIILAIATFAFVSQISPGPNNFMLMASGMNYGWYRSMPHMLGIGVGFPMMVLLVGLGILQVLELLPYGFLVLKVLSSLYLLYLAWKIAIARPVESGTANANAKPLTFLQAAAFQWVNPKAWAMALTAISLYTPEGRPLASVFLIALVFTCTGSITINTWTLLGQQLRYFLRSPAAFRTFNIVCALALVATLYPIFMEGP